MRRIPSFLAWNKAIKDDVTESVAYMVGNVACTIAFPHATLARDFCADIARGGIMGAAPDSPGTRPRCR